jgi:hypothetical protein
MLSDAARAGFRLGFLVLMLAVLPLPFLSPGSAEFVVSVLAAGMALAFIGGVTLLLRLQTRRAAPPSRKER